MLGDQRGSVTVLAACAAVALMVVAALVIQVGSAVAARHRAQSVADLAALAAAGRLVLGYDDGCDRARELARRSEVSLTRCASDGSDVVVSASVPVQLAMFGDGMATASARAGP